MNLILTIFCTSLGCGVDGKSINICILPRSLILGDQSVSASAGITSWDSRFWSADNQNLRIVLTLVWSHVCLAKVIYGRIPGVGPLIGWTTANRLMLLKQAPNTEHGNKLLFIQTKLFNHPTTVSVLNTNSNKVQMAFGICCLSIWITHNREQLLDHNYCVMGKSVMDIFNWVEWVGCSKARQVLLIFQTKPVK